MRATCGRVSIGLLAGLFLLTASARAAQTLVPVNAVWRYLDTGTNLGVAWRAPGFNDSAWASGPARLGFGGDGELTLINGGPSGDRHRTIYFRHTFFISELSLLTNFAARLQRDDGAVVFINGVEAFRQNLPLGVINSTTLAILAVAEEDEAAFHLEPVAPELFVPGTNVIAVEVHQVDPGSSDLGFALELTANTPAGNFPPEAFLETPANGAAVDATETFVVRMTARDGDQGLLSVAILRDGLAVASGPGPTLAFTNGPLGAGTHFFAARATDLLGEVRYSPTNAVTVRPPGQQVLAFTSFHTETNLVWQEQAVVRDGRIHLNDEGGGRGGVYFPAKQFVRDGFDLVFRYDIHNLVNSGGDGLAFIIQNNVFLQEGGGGDSKNYSGISNSLAIEFDTWGNPESSDPSSGHISIQTRGTAANSSGHSASLGSVNASLDGTHTVRVLYAPPVLSVFLDNTNTPVLQISTNLAALFPLDFGRAWLGFGAATGAGIEEHDILSFSLTTPEWIRTGITSPAARQILTAPVALNVQASAVAFTGSVTHVEFYDDGVLFADVFAPPFHAPWNTTRLGAHRLVAVAYDSAGHSTPSEPVEVYVQAGDGRATLVPAGAVWRYHDRGWDFTNNWTTAEFDDLGWRLGPAQLGFGDDDEVTHIEGGPSSSRFPTIFFRRAFEVTNVAALSNLAVRLLRDDGAIVHLNGTEVFRSNLPQGPVSYGTLSSTAASGANETNFFVAAINPALLVSGRNLLAVEVHQSDAASSDLSFDLELIANSPLGNAAPTVTISGVTNGQVIAEGQLLNYTVSATDPGGAVTNLQVFRNGVPLTNRAGAAASFSFSTNASGLHTITARATDNSGQISAPASVTLAVARPLADVLMINDFSAPRPLMLQAQAQAVANVLRLVPGNALGATGGGWWTTRAFLTNGFEAQFTFRLHGPSGRGADGFALVLQGNDAPALGGSGGNLGYGGITNSLAVEFDTYSSGGPDVYHEVAVHSGGVGENGSDSARRLATTTSVPVFADGLEHTARVSYQAGTLRVFLDNLATPVLTVSVSLPALLNFENGTAWIGFTAATGFETETHDLQSWHFVAHGLMPVRLSGPQFAPGQFQLRFATQPGRKYQPQSSLTLTNWTDAGAPLTATGTVTTWMDPGAPLPAARFYRARLVE